MHSRNLAALTLAVALARSAAFAGEPVAIGFRGDGWSGIFPADARPPTEFDGVTGRNLVWKTPLPNFGNASPIAVGKKVFTVCDPGWPEGTDVPVLVCVDADSGKLLWQQPIDPYDAWPREKAEPARKARREFFAWRFKLNRAIYKAGRGDAKAHGEAAAMAGKAAKDVPAVGTPADTRTTANLTEAAPMRKQLETCGFDPHPTWGWMCLGVGMPTPASDGRRVFVATGYKTMSAFDLDGKRLWHVFHDDVDYRRVRGQWVESCGHSPIVVGDRVLMHLWDRVWCYDAATGKVLWATEAKPMPQHSMGQPVVLRLPAGAGEAPTIFCISGQLIRIADGKLLAEGIGTFRACAAIGSDGRDLILGHNAGTGGHHQPLPGRRWSETGTTPAVRFRLTASGDRAEPELVWQTKARIGHYPIALDGRLLTTDGGVLSLTDGQAIAADRKGLNLAYNGMILAGGHLYGQPNIITEKGKGDTILVALARYDQRVTLLAKRPIEPGVEETDPARLEKLVAQTGSSRRLTGWYGWHSAYAAPFASGNRLFVRTFDFLYCFGDKSQPFVPSKAFEAVK
jgi:outer membrane protein assembly factor BamB